MSAEGYIKFDLRWTGGPVLPAGLLGDIITWRQKLHRLGFIGMYPDGIGYGNISRRWDATRFAISGTATGGIDEIGPEHFTLVTGFNLEGNTLDCLGPVRASAESMTHGAIYRCAPEVRVVMHIHHLAFWEKLLNRVPTTRQDVAYGTPGMALEIGRLFAGEDSARIRIICMAGHREGIISFGESAEEAGQTLLRWAETCGIRVNDDFS